GGRDVTLERAATGLCASRTQPHRTGRAVAPPLLHQCWRLGPPGREFAAHRGAGRSKRDETRILRWKRCWRSEVCPAPGDLWKESRAREELHGFGSNGHAMGRGRSRRQAVDRWHRGPAVSRRNRAVLGVALEQGTEAGNHGRSRRTTEV